MFSSVHFVSQQISPSEQQSKYLQRDISEVHVTRAMWGTGCWSNHWLLRSVLSVRLTRPRRHQAIRRRKRDVIKLRSDDIQEQLKNCIQPTVRLPVPMLREHGSGQRTSLLRSHLKYWVTAQPSTRIGSTIITSSFNRMAWQPQTIYIQYFIHNNAIIIHNNTQ